MDSEKTEFFGAYLVIAWFIDSFFCELSMMAFFEFVLCCEPMQEFYEIMVQLRVLFLAPVLEIPSSSLCGIGFFHRTPRCVAENVVVKVVFHYGFRLLLKNIEGLRVATE